MSTAFGKKALGAGPRLSEGGWVQRSRSRGERARESPRVGNRLAMRHLGPVPGSRQRPGLGAGDRRREATGGQLAFSLQGNLRGWAGEWRRLRSRLLRPSHRATRGRGARVCPTPGWAPLLVRKRPGGSQAAERPEVSVWEPHAFSHRPGNQLPGARWPRGAREAAVPAAAAGRPGLEGSPARVTQPGAAPCPASPGGFPRSLADMLLLSPEFTVVGGSGLPQA